MDTSSELDPRLKFGTGGEQCESYRYAHVYERQRSSDGSERLLIAPRSGHVALLCELAGCLCEPFGLLYVLVVPRNGRNAAGRYEAPVGLSAAQVRALLAAHSLAGNRRDLADCGFCRAGRDCRRLG